VYNTDLFDEATITRMLDILKHCWRIVANPQARLQTYTLSEAELHQLLVEWNDTQVDYPQAQCIHQLFEEQVSDRQRP